MVRSTTLWSEEKNSVFYGPKLEKEWETLVYEV